MRSRGKFNPQAFYTLIPDRKIQQSQAHAHTQTQGTWRTDEVQMPNRETNMQYVLAVHGFVTSCQHFKELIVAF